MLVVKDKKENGSSAPKLKTEGPLAKKDQQGQSIERQQNLAKKALDAWRRLQEKVKQTKAR